MKKRIVIAILVTGILLGGVVAGAAITWEEEIKNKLLSGEYKESHTEWALRENPSVYIEGFVVGYKEGYMEGFGHGYCRGSEGNRNPTGKTVPLIPLPTIIEPQPTDEHIWYAEDSSEEYWEFWCSNPDFAVIHSRCDNY